MTGNLDPDSILLLQEIAKLAALKKATVTVNVCGLSLHMSEGSKYLDHMISWIDLRFVTMGTVEFVTSNLEHMRGELERRT